MNESRSYVYILPSRKDHGLADAVQITDGAKQAGVSLILSPTDLVVRFPNGVVLRVEPIVMDNGRLGLGWKIGGAP